jgi:hypothetical protein
MTVLLRYLDVFTDDFTEGRKRVAFLNDIFGDWAVATSSANPAGGKSS